MVGVGLTGEAPYTDVLTHGWVLDAEGRAMHKSLGNVMSPLDITARLGADVVRWWALATDWRNDVRVGDEILQRVADAYRKVRNTFRFLLGNLADFDARRHALPLDALQAVDRAFLDRLRDAVTRARAAYGRLEFHRALDALLDVCTVDLSAVYLDVAKDRLYTLAPDDPARRSAQTVLWQALQRLSVAVSPALVFTADEVWEHHPSLREIAPSVHLAEWPEDAPAGAEQNWALLLRLREAVNASLEPLRAAKTIATTTEAAVAIRVGRDVHERLRGFAGELEGFLLVSQAALEPREGAGDAIEITAAGPSGNPKCERCWTYRPDVAREGPAAGLCARCSAVLAVRAGA
jgi:isoleucyl-tRNA synthetase